MAHSSTTEIEVGLWAPYHQHTFCARLDLDIDGSKNTVIEVDSIAKRMGPENVHGGAYVTQETVLANESMSGRMLNLISSRHWNIGNTGIKNHMD